MSYIKKPSVTDLYRDDYMEKLLQHICFGGGFGISYIQPDEIRDDWYNRIAMNDKIKEMLVDHARRYIVTQLPHDLVHQRNFLKTLATKMSDILALYFVRDPKISTIDAARARAMREIYDNSIAFNHIIACDKEKHAKHVENRNKEQQKRAAAALRRANEIRNGAINNNGKKSKQA